VPCDETGSRQLIDGALLDGGLRIHRGAQVQQICEDVLCLVPAEEED
jgi:hypothetical protein